MHVHPVQSGGGGGGIGGGGRMVGGAFGSLLLRSVASICSSFVSLSLPMYGTNVVVVSLDAGVVINDDDGDEDDVTVSFANPVPLSLSTPKKGSRSSIGGVGGGGAKSVVVVDTLTRAMVSFSSLLPYFSFL